jgi:FkbM family methyltransferase
VFLSICLLIVTINTVIEHGKKSDIPSIATAEVKQQVAEITRGFESDLKQVQAESLAQVTSLQQEINQVLVESNTLHGKSDAEIQSLKSQLVALQQEMAATERVPQPFAINGEGPDLVFDTVEIHGVKVEFAAEQHEQLAELHSHIQREINGFAILKDAIEQSTQQPPLVLDVGASHGLYSLFAAKLGADVIAVEPQQVQCRVILAAAKKNEVDGRITVYHSAVLEKYETVTMRNTDGEGVTIVREGGTGGNDGMQVKAFPIYKFLSGGDSRRVAFLKIDVNGFDLHAIQSAQSLFAQNRVDNALVEFGPPSHWNDTAGDDPQMGLMTLKNLHTQYGMEPRIIEGWEYNVWPQFISELGMISEAASSKAEKTKVFRLMTDTDKTLLMDSMEAIKEASFLWLVPDGVKSEYPVFHSDCSNYRKGNQVAGPDGMLTSVGCRMNVTDTDTAANVTDTAE